MRYLKYFENDSNNEPKLGDYVKIDSENFAEELVSFFATNIGQIIKVDNDPDTSYNYTVKFNNVMPIFDDDKAEFSTDEIKKWSSDFDIIKIDDDVNKFNL